MTTIVLFHHAAGLTEGVRALADRLAQAGHLVLTPDLYDGHRFTTIDEAWPSTSSSPTSRYWPARRMP